MKANTGTPDTRLVSLNVGVSRLLDHSGRPVQSGISETPVEIALWIDENRLEGDDQADTIGHGGPHRRICAHPLESLRAVRDLPARMIAFGIWPVHPDR